MKQLQLYWFFKGVGGKLQPRSRSPGPPVWAVTSSSQPRKQELAYL